MRVRTNHRPGDFAITVITLAGAVEIRTHDEESWKALGEAP
jgi:hypothetical protein